MNDEASPSLAARLADGVGEDYTIEGEIGRGGMGVVYLARDLKLKRRVAIKVLPPELAFRPEIKKRFIREAQTAARLSHPHIVPIHAVGEGGGLVYFVMGYVDGESLGARLKRRGRLPVEEARRIMKETADALGMAHTMGVIHRDVKPDNVLLDGTRRRVMVTDFGIAKALSEVGSGTLTGTGVAIGTPTYMSPEQAAGDGEIDARTDLYALGIVAYEMVTGRVPFRAPTVPGILMKQITEPPPDILTARPECPEEFAATIARCLEKDPGARWPTADALRRALDTRASGPYRRPTTTGRVSRSSDRSATGRSSRHVRTDRARSADRPAPPASRRNRAVQRRERVSPSRKKRERAEVESGGPKIVRDFRASFASYVSVNGGLLLLNILTTGLAPPWFLIPAVAWGIGLSSQYSKLWMAGYSWRDVIDRPPAHDAIDASKTPALKRGRTPRLPSAEPSTAEFGQYTSQLRQLNRDHQAIIQIVDRLPESEKGMLPDVVPTVESLMKRATDLGTTLGQMEGDFDPSALTSLDGRIKDAEEGGSGPERDRRLDLLRRQRQTLADLLERRGRVEAQFESCVLAVQNVRFDLLRLRSAGVAAVLDDLTMVTQQAKALNRDVNAAIEAAGEIKELLGQTAPRPIQPS